MEFTFKDFKAVCKVSILMLFSSAWALYGVGLFLLLIHNLPISVDNITEFLISKANTDTFFYIHIKIWSTVFYVSIAYPIVSLIKLLISYLFNIITLKFLVMLFIQIITK